MALGADPELCLEDDRDRPVVEERDLHGGAEDAAFDVDALVRQTEAEPLVERLGVFRGRCAGEARPVPLPRVLLTSEVNRRMEDA